MTDKPLKIFNASAGSGKTYTLVQEYLRIVLHSDNPLKFRSILAMTFTNKAANEMKERILEGLIQLGRPPHDKNEEELSFLVATSKNLGIPPKKIEERSAKILNRILHNYGAFSVMTIDKFTHKVIRTFAKDLNISIDFDVELDMQRLRKNVTDMLFDQIGRDQDLTALMLRYANSNLAEDKSWNFTNQLYDFSNEIFKEEAIKSIDLLKKLSPQDFLNVQTDLVKENKVMIAQITQQGKEAYDLAKSKGLTADDFAGKRNSIIAHFKRLADGTFDKKPSATLYKNVVDGKWGHPQSPNKHGADEIAPLLEQYFNQANEFQEQNLKSIIINKEILKNLNNLSLLNHLLQLVDQVKADDNVLLISDFYRKIAEIITEEPVPFIYERLGVRYAHFLLDEFQDTSRMQWINLIPLVHNALASKQSNLIVGDGKQAIYRWRNGEVEQFTGLPNKVLNPDNIASLNEAEPLFQALGEKYPLTKNYRSAPEVVAFNNDIFTTITNGLPDNLKVIYEDTKQEATKKSTGYVESVFSKELKREDQLDYVLDVVERAIANGYDLQDIAILTRNNHKGAEISRFLTEKGYKIISPDSLFIGKDLSVKFLINLMAGIITPTNKNYKIKTLEHFANLILKEDVRDVIEKHADAILEQDLIAIFKTYNYDLVPPAIYHNLFEFVEALISTFNLNVAQNPFLQFFLEQVHLFEKRNNSNTRDFVTWFNDRGHRSSIISPDGANAIQVMTIHKSKGLQFPIVICPYMDWMMRLSNQVSWIDAADNKLPAFFLKMNKDLADTDLAPIYHDEEGKFMLDQLNLLYVAFTRAEMGLFISGTVTKFDSPAKLWLANYFAEAAYGNFNDSKFTYGEFLPTTKSKRSVAANFPIEFHGKKMDKPVLSYKSAENWDIDELDEKRLFGTKVHHILSELKAAEELTAALEKSLLKGRINLTEKVEIKQVIEGLFKDPHFASYFESDQQMNETEVIDNTGRKLIPDKIILLPEQTLVIDFKTGQATPDHKKQVQQYLNVLFDLGYENGVGEIYYTETGKVVTVSR